MKNAEKSDQKAKNTQSIKRNSSMGIETRKLESSTS
jgi:hypothetical protein